MDEPDFCCIPTCGNYLILDDNKCIYCREYACKEHYTPLGLCTECYEKLKEYTLEELLLAIEDDNY